MTAEAALEAQFGRVFPAPFRIEAGRSYRTRDGRSAGPMLPTFQLADGTWWGGEGRFFGGGGSLAGESWGADGGYSVWGPSLSDGRDLVEEISARHADEARGSADVEEG